MLRIYQYKPEDYVKTLNKNIGVCEIQGDRAEQEDALVVNVDEKQIKGIEHLSSEQRKLIFEKTIKKMQDQCGDERNQGSTVCTVITWIDSERVLTSCTAYVGDSSAYLVIIENDKVVIAKRLNLNLHNPPSGHLFHQFYSLALNRAIGDRSFEEVGLSHEPEIDEFKIKLPDNSRAFIIVACDGLVEADILDTQDIGSFVAKEALQTPEKIAAELAVLAYGLGSHDNISVAVIEMDPKKKGPVSASVFDGHGGNRVSTALAKHFYPVLGSEIKSLKQ